MCGDVQFMQNDLFNNKIIKEFVNNISVINKQKSHAEEWLKKLQSGKLKNEASSVADFKYCVLVSILGYDPDHIIQEHERADFAIKDKEGNNLIAVEIKGSETNLFKKQYRNNKEHETPIKQTWDHMGKINSKYGVCSNFNKFVLLTKSYGYRRYYEFDFEVINKPDKLKEFVGIFSKKQIENEEVIDKILRKSDKVENEITSEFYSIFRDTRSMIISEFCKSNVSTTVAANTAQTFLNRIMFWFFAEDKKFVEQTLFRTTVKNILQSSDLGKNSHNIFTGIISMFEHFNKGDVTRGIFGFNGGLFSGKMPESVYFDDFADKPHAKPNNLDDDLKKLSTFMIH